MIRPQRVLAMGHRQHHVIVKGRLMAISKHKFLIRLTVPLVVPYKCLLLVVAGKQEGRREDEILRYPRNCRSPACA